MIRRIQDLLYDQGFTISGARNKLLEIVSLEGDKPRNGEDMLDGVDMINGSSSELGDFADSADFEDSQSANDGVDLPCGDLAAQRLQFVRRELFEIRDLLNSSK